MAYFGLNPSEHITKTRNTLARTCLVEVACFQGHVDPSHQRCDVGMRFAAAR